MAKIFSLNIIFKSKEYPTLVIQQEIEDEVWYKVRYMDEDLHNILSSDHLSFNQLGELKQTVYLKNESATSLIQTTQEAVFNYLQLGKY